MFRSDGVRNPGVGGWLGLATALLFGCATASYGQSPPVETVGGVSLPGVPVEVTERARAAQAHSLDKIDTSLYSDTRIALLVEPGTTEVIPIARNYLNRIITPFEQPKLITVNEIQFRKEGSSVFVTTGSDTPVGVHILSNDPADTRSISLALVPRPIPPRTIQLRWPGQGGLEPHQARALANKAERWEQASPYVETVMELVSLIARGEVPPGYSLVEGSDTVPCEIPGVRLYAGQRLTGSRFSVHVLKATNEGTSTLEIVQSAGCRGAGVVAVAPWPDAYLIPGASTEVYVVFANALLDERSTATVRPSLLTR